jgi:hypothetical protein
LWWIIILLALVILFLLIVIDGARRYKDKTIKNLYAAQSTSAYRILRLAEVVGRASEIDSVYDGREDEAPKQVFETWITYLTMALSDAYGPDGVRDFTNGNPESLKVPDYRHGWFLLMRNRVSEVLDNEMRAINKARTDLHQQN